MRIKIILSLTVVMLILSFYQSVKLDESIKHVTPALQSQREVKNPRESNMGNELIRTYLKGNLGVSDFVIDNETLDALLSKKKELQNFKDLKLPNLSPPRIVKNVKITAYSSCKSIPKGIANYKKIRRRNGTGTGITKSGEKVHEGVAAADPRYYPEGTVFYEPKTGKTLVVKDIGENIKGRYHIDIYIDKYEDAIKWGNPKLKVWVRVAQK